MSKWRVPRVSKPTARVTTIALGTAMGIAGALTLPHLRGSNADCTLIQARFETSGSPALELHLCAMVPSARAAAIVRYDIALRIAIMPNKPATLK